MTNYDFISSNKPHHRFYRHLFFWLVFSVHFFIQNLIIGKVNEALNPRTPLEAIINISYFLPIYIVSVYIFIELIIPSFLFKKHYAPFFICSAALLMFNFAGCYLCGVLYEHVEWKMPYKEITFAANKYHAIVNGGFVSVMVLGIAGGIRTLKKWLQKQKENEVLAQQKIASELKLLKIQINPRFLFHSLNTVKQQILTGSEQSPHLILQVADLLSYILYESDNDYVLLEKELRVVSDYLTLEENGYVDKVTVKFHVTGNVRNKYITPLILLTVVETSFEYFIENFKNFSTEIIITGEKEHVSLRIMYTISDKSFDSIEFDEKFDSTKKQLNNLYAGNHHFSLEAEIKDITIHLQLPFKANELVLPESLVSNVKYENV